MATQSSGGYMELEAKLLEVSEQTIKVFFFDGGKQGVILKESEGLGEWKRASIGDKINVRVPTAYADENKLLGDQTYGTGGNKGTGGTTITATFDCTFANGNVTATFVFVEEGDEFRIRRVNYHSPLLKTALTCPKCGKGVKLGDTFCPGCGEKLAAPAEPEPVAPARPTDPGGSVQEF